MYILCAIVMCDQYNMYTLYYCRCISHKCIMCICGVCVPVILVSGSDE